MSQSALLQLEVKGEQKDYHCCGVGVPRKWFRQRMVYWYIKRCPFCGKRAHQLCNWNYTG
jgi:hypothetical protein